MLKQLFTAARALAASLLLTTSLYGQVGPVPGYGSISLGSVQPPTGAFASSASNVCGVTPVTFTAQGIGTASGSRLVVVVVSSGIGTGTPNPPTSVTVAGASATNIVNHTATSAGGGINESIWTVSVATGTTANIVVTHAAAQDSVGIGVFALANLSSTTAFATNSSGTSSGTSTSVSLNTNNGGFVVGGATSFLNSAQTHTWTGLTKSADTNPVATVDFSSGISATTTQTPRTVSVSIGAANVLTAAAASWR